jgi:hypothetical protein
MNKVNTHNFCKKFSPSPKGEGRVGSLEVETNADEFNQTKESAW